MSALVIDFAGAVEALRAVRRTGAKSVGPLPHTSPVSQDFMFWSGASGMRYVHTIYPLLTCPELPDANVILARRLPSGGCEVMRIARVEHGVPSLNLAELRQVSAELGANEIHVHLLAGNADRRECVEHDIVSAEASAGRVAS